jgi:HlyD family secretion protein
MPSRGRLIVRTAAVVVVGSLVTVGAWILYAEHRAQADDHVAAEPVAREDVISAITALGRLEPKDGVFEVAGPSRPTAVIAELLVDDGDMVEQDQPIAVLDTKPEAAAEVARLDAELRNAQTDYTRWYKVFKEGSASETVIDAARLKVDVIKAQLQAARATLDQATVRAPVRGQVIKVHARRGERVGQQGIAEIAQNDAMYAIAEVYETDVRWVKVGQPAKVTSPALTEPLTGTVEQVGFKIGKLDVLAADPAAKTDARVVEVKIRLDDSKRAAPLTNLQVDVFIQPG